MTSQQVTHLCEQVASLTQELAVAQQQLTQVGHYLLCNRRSEDRPLQVHGMSRVCLECYEALRLEFVRMSLVQGSLRSLIQERMHRGQPCPFCGQGKRHSSSCYLDSDAGLQLLDEYQAIERHRDLLLEERGRGTDHAPHALVQSTHGLKSRAHLNGHAHSPPSA